MTRIDYKQRGVAMKLTCFKILTVSRRTAKHQLTLDLIGHLLHVRISRVTANKIVKTYITPKITKEEKNNLKITHLKKDDQQEWEETQNMGKVETTQYDDRFKNHK